MLHVDDCVHCKHSWVYVGIDKNFGYVQQIQIKQKSELNNEANKR